MADLILVKKFEKLHFYAYYNLHINFLIYEIMNN